MNFMSTSSVNSFSNLGNAGCAQARHNRPSEPGPDDVPDEFPQRDNRGGPDDTSDPDFGGRSSSDNSYSGPDGTYDSGPLF